MTEEELASGVYAKRNIEIVSAKGSCLWDSEGKMYLDMGASYGVCNVGHCNPEVSEAIKGQAENIFYISSTYPNPTSLFYQTYSILTPQNDFQGTSERLL